MQVWQEIATNGIKCGRRKVAPLEKQGREAIAYRYGYSINCLEHILAWFYGCYWSGIFIYNSYSSFISLGKVIVNQLYRHLFHGGALDRVRTHGLLLREALIKSGTSFLSEFKPV